MLTLRAIGGGASSLMTSFVATPFWPFSSGYIRLLKRCAISGVKMSPCLALRPGGPDAGGERILRRLDLRRVVGLLERRRILLELLVELHVLVDALLEVLEHERFRVDLGFLRAHSCPAQTPTDEKSCSNTGHLLPPGAFCSRCVPTDLTSSACGMCDNGDACPILEVFPMRPATRSSTCHWSLRGLTLRSRYVVPALAVVLTVSASLYAQQQTPFRSGASTVAVYTTVTDSTGRLVPDLTQDDFEIYDNGKLQPITLFATETQPITVVVMLDRSGSMKDSFNLVCRRRRGVRQAAAAGRQGAHRELLHKDPGRSRGVHQRPQGARRDPAQRAPARGPDAAVERRQRRDPRARCLRMGARSCCSSPTAWTVPGNFKTNNLSVMDVMDRATKEDVMLYAIGLESRLPYGRRQSPLGGGA